MKIDKLRIELIEKITAFIIITNTIIIGVEASFHSKDKFLSIFYFIDIIVLSFFGIELILRVSNAKMPIKLLIPALIRLIPLQKEELSDVDKKKIEDWLWILFDSVLIILGILSLFRHVFEHPELILLFRLLRVFRVFRIFELSNTLKEIEKKIISVIPTITTFLALIVLILYSYAIIGMYMYDFHKFESIDFSSIYSAMSGLFIMMTNGWSDCLMELRAHSIVPDLYSDIFIFSFFIFSVIVTLNVFLAVMSSQIQDKIIKDKKINKKERPLEDTNDYDRILSELTTLNKKVDDLASEIKNTTKK